MSALNAPDHPDYYQVDDAHGAAVLKCAKCTKTFRTFQQLKQHMLVHSNIRKHSCHFCDKTFKQQCHLQQHERLHTGQFMVVIVSVWIYDFLIWINKDYVIISARILSLCLNKYRNSNKWLDKRLFVGRCTVISR